MSRKLRVGQYQQKHLQLVVRNERRNIVPEVQHVMRDGIVRVRAGRVFQQRLERLHIITRLSSAKFQLCWDSRPQELKGRRLTAVIRSVTSSIHLAIGLEITTHVISSGHFCTGSPSTSLGVFDHAVSFGARAPEACHHQRFLRTAITNRGAVENHHAHPR